MLEDKAAKKTLELIKKSTVRNKKKFVSFYSFD